ncbi:ribosome maturation factor RimM [Microbacterium enclense]|uniref:Ribosome maturation factor RimM n=1 Tax=Microbacterium enclense TaxID=993073 RepID=A0A1G6HJ63_9MICO|nr:ribosome maturation factor RimM [Microbacterium enclense]KSU55328.1 16S rRNA processing protein RimM [Microbacterium enclense]SDB93476.1 16S rRNA processing protein RimM [Microbacterium enclense]
MAAGDTAGAQPAKTQLRVGRLVKAHGLKGAFKLELYTDDPDGRFVPGSTFTLQVPESSPWHGRELTVREFRWMNSHPVVFFEGVDDRTAAEELVKAILWIDQDAETAPAEDDAWYDHQLVGLNVVRDGVVIGRVVRVDHFPAQDLLIVRPSGEDREVLVPFVGAIVPEVDIAGGRVVVTPPTGLFEDLPSDDGDEPEAESAASADADDAATADAETDGDENTATRED